MQLRHLLGFWTEGRVLYPAGSETDGAREITAAVSGCGTVPAA